MTHQHNHLVIMAGGIGSRFWPMSTEEKPKQFIDVLGVGRTLIQMTYDRFHDICPDENVWIVTNKKYALLVHEQLPDVPQSHILTEPCRRNTAPCIAYVSWRIKVTDPHANIVVSPSDHIVMNTEEFRRVIVESLSFTQESDSIVTLGMRVTRPETGYGYIEADLSSKTLRNKEIYRVDTFHEKPDLAKATRYMGMSNYYWNSGIFIWNVETIVNALRIYAPRINNIFERLQSIYGTPQEQSAIDCCYPDCENISIDYAVMEKAEEIFVFPADFGWSDLGTWGSLLTQTKHDLNGNACIGSDIKTYDTHGCIIHTTQERQVVIQGLSDCIVAEHDNRLLVCRLSEEQRIKSFLEQ
ncbi:mannose-1-phosphate guanylyltransferase [Hallella multisaccharivorax]|uniref:mannose-1-phosphate guanylyltransferase n=1 Tax=Hallella multisaccharivorax DSM 17128 TaxID=688246 RepID=F8N9P2_9BACT|nr:mannose-1-phosphate guanylyltransferase [Hallella multisaccharivorax]EGN56684.1 mannose-1-phosphate guanylyltransferase (GDP) [Hallella multisaccharivorax DSM 17128]